MIADACRSAARAPYALPPGGTVSMSVRIGDAMLARAIAISPPEATPRLADARKMRGAVKIPPAVDLG